MKDGRVTCLECSEVIHKQPFVFTYSNHYNYFKRRYNEYSSKHYFIKLLDQLEISFDYSKLINDFDQQEIILKKVLKEKKRTNSLNRKYKLKKLLQRQGVVYEHDFKSLKTQETCDLIMREAWEHLNWSWINR